MSIIKRRKGDKYLIFKGPPACHAYRQISRQAGSTLLRFGRDDKEMDT